MHIILEKTSETTYVLVDGSKAHGDAKSACTAAKELAKANHGKKYSVANLWPAISCEPVVTVRYVTDGSAVSGVPKAPSGKPKGRPRKSVAAPPAAALPVATPPAAAPAAAAPPPSTAAVASEPGVPTGANSDKDGSKALFGTGAAPAAGTKPDDGGKELF